MRIRPAGAGTTYSTFTPNLRRWRRTGRNILIGNTGMRFFQIAVADPGETMRGGLSTRHRRFAAGFSLLELLVVITIMLVLMGIAMGRYEKSVTKAREAALRQ